MTAWIRFVLADEDVQERVELAFNSLMIVYIEGLSQIKWLVEW